MGELLYWIQSATIESRSFTCGHCGNPIASNLGYSNQMSKERIYLCHACGKPTYTDIGGIQVPGASFGTAVQHIPNSDVTNLYDEARHCMQVNAYTASVLCSRKLLMNISVERGAAEGKSFVEYVRFLETKGYLPPDGKDWADHIRTKGNEATHEVHIMTRDDAADLLTFVEMLLKFIYEYPGTIRAKLNPSATTS